MDAPSSAARPVVLERAFEVDARGRCHLRVPRASVTVRAGGRGEVRVTVTAARGTDPSAARALARRLRMRYAGGVLHVELERRPHLNVRDWRALRDGRWPALHLDVHMPARFGAGVQASSGAVVADGLGGPVALKATGGTIRATHLGGRLSVQARRCRTVIEAFSGQTCSVHVHGGELVMRGTAARATTVESNATHLQLSEIDGTLDLAARSGRAAIAGLRGALDARVVGGECSLTPAQGHTVRLRAPGSDVHLRLPVGFAAPLCLTADRLDLTALESFEGERTPRHADGALGRGSSAPAGALIEAAAPGGSLRCLPTA